MNFNIFENLEIIKPSSNPNIDYQGINWESRSRKSYQLSRINNFMTSNGNVTSQNSMKIFNKNTEKEFISANRFYKGIRVDMKHFQLPNNLIAISDHDLYYIDLNTIKHFSSKRQSTRNFYSFHDEISPTCLNSIGKYLVVGFMNGKILIIDTFEKNTIDEFYGTLNSEICIINNIEIIDELNGFKIKCATNQNNIVIHYFSFQTMKATYLSDISFSTAVNNISTANNSNLIAAALDQPEILIIDSKEKKVVIELKGHLVENFGCHFHKDGNTLATSGEDSRVRLWDIRFPKFSIQIIPSIMSPVYKVKFYKDYLFFPEFLDFLHVYKEPFNDFQIFDFFGNVSGFDISANNIFLSTICKNNEGIFCLKFNVNDGKI